MALERVDLVREVAARGQRASHRDERADDANAHVARLFGLQEVRDHDDAVFGEGQRQSRREFEACEVVAICNHLIALGTRELEAEVGHAPAHGKTHAARTSRHEPILTA
ncbi:MAG: hypothetical protein JNK82_25860 [Myxococcaceae bacterium]|nr:hypothetical protein [Myxococcaceae bacterium]